MKGMVRKMSIALCKCGLDMIEHDLEGDINGNPVGCAFEASGTKYRCEAMIHIQGHGTFLCPRPRYHEDHHVTCGPLLGRKLW